MSNSQYLKTEIQAYLEDNDILTQGEVNELLLDCFCYFDNKDKQRVSLTKNFEKLLDNAKKQKTELNSLLNVLETSPPTSSAKYEEE